MTNEGEELYTKTIHIAGLAELLCDVSREQVADSNFSRAQNIAWSYEVLAAACLDLANKLSEVAP